MGRRSRRNALRPAPRGSAQPGCRSRDRSAAARRWSFPRRSPRLPQPPHKWSVLRGPVLGAAWQSDRRRRVGHKELRLDGDRHAVQRTQGYTAGTGGVGVRLAERGRTGAPPRSGVGSPPRCAERALRPPHVPRARRPRRTSRSLGRRGSKTPLVRPPSIPPGRSCYVTQPLRRSSKGRSSRRAHLLPACATSVRAPYVGGGRAYPPVILS
jgi:hypothetical protein